MLCGWKGTAHLNFGRGPAPLLRELVEALETRYEPTLEEAQDTN